MLRKNIFSWFLVLLTFNLFGQVSFDSPMKKKHMEKDLKLFMEIREKANSGVYKYRTKTEIDSIYKWAYQQILLSKSVGDFYNIICKITDFEGSLHNGTSLSRNVNKSLAQESSGYFPVMIKYIEGYWRCNIDSTAIPLGSRILEINGVLMEDVISQVDFYYTTDGFNTTGKRLGLTSNFPIYYRIFFGQKDTFNIKYQKLDGTVQESDFNGISFKEYSVNQSKMYSLPSDYLVYSDYQELSKHNELYQVSYIDSSTVLLRVNSFDLGEDGNDPIHIKYSNFLDSTFTQLKEKRIENLIVDVRFNGGGTDPNDSETWSYLIDKPLKDVKKAWTSCGKLPKTGKLNIKWFKKPFANIVVKKEVKKNLTKGSDGNFYYDKFKTIYPKTNAFTGNLYLLIGPQTASAASQFAAMVAGNTDAIVIGEETMGGYYGHNGVFPVSYVLPKSKIVFYFSMVNITQNVPDKVTQPFGSGVMPDYTITTSMEDFLSNEDSVMKFVTRLIHEKN